LTQFLFFLDLFDECQWIGYACRLGSLLTPREHVVCLERGLGSIVEVGDAEIRIDDDFLILPIRNLDPHRAVFLKDTLQIVVFAGELPDLKFVRYKQADGLLCSVGQANVPAHQVVEHCRQGQGDSQLRLPKQRLAHHSCSEATCHWGAAVTTIIITAITIEVTTTMKTIRGTMEMAATWVVRQGNE